MIGLFRECEQLRYLDLSCFYTDLVRSMHCMFYGCQNLKEIKGINRFFTPWVFDMRGMFEKCPELEYLDLSNFNTNRVMDMSFMFKNCHKLKVIKGINKFNTFSVRDMKAMFSGCNVLKSLDLSSFNTSNVIDMNSMFEECFELEYLNLSNFNTSNVNDMAFMFYKCYVLKEIKGLKNFNTIKVINIESMFEDCHDSENYEKLIPQLNKNKKAAKKLNIKKELIKVYFLSSDQRVQYDTECFNTDNFVILEQKLFLKFPDLKNMKIIYLYGGSIISDKSLTLAELNMKNEAHILINYIE